MLPIFIRQSLFLVFLPVLSFAQTNPVVPTTAQSDVSVPDTIRNSTAEQDGQNQQSSSGQAVIFAPSPKRKIIKAVEISDKLRIDGYLNEADWQRAKPVNRFIQVDPAQGKRANFDTDIRVLYNPYFLYVAVRAYHYPIWSDIATKPSAVRRFLRSIGISKAKC